MSLTSTAIQQPIASKPKSDVASNEGAAALMAALMLAVYGVQKSKKSFRQAKRKVVAELFKYKIKSSVSKVKALFSKKEVIEGISDTTLLYILLGLLVLILLLAISPVAAIILLLVGVLLILLTRK